MLNHPIDNVGQQTSIPTVKPILSDDVVKGQIGITAFAHNAGQRLDCQQSRIIWLHR